MTAFIKLRACHVETFGASAAIVYSQIAWRTEQAPEGWRASYALLSQETGLPQGTVRRCCAALREAAVLSAERASSDDATLVWQVVCAGQEQETILNTPPVQSDHLPDESILDTSSFETVETETRPPSSPPDASGGEEQQGEIPLLSLVPEQPAAPAQDEEFDGFWRAYPRKVGKAKARTAYRSARRAASLEQIAAGLVAQLPDLRARDLSMVPHPTTWLNQHRWEDEPSHAAQPRTGPRNFDLERMMNRAAGHDTELPAPAARAIAMLEGRP